MDSSESVNQASKLRNLEIGNIMSEDMQGRALAFKPAGMLAIHRYFAGDSLNTVPASLTSDQKARYGVAPFRKDWESLSDTEKEFFKVEVGAVLGGAYL